MSNVLNVELIDLDGKVLKRQYHPISEGMVTGNLVLPKKIQPGKYYLRAYTRWMKNYHESAYAMHPIFIGNDQDIASSDRYGKTALNISPESGKLVSGLMNRMVLNIPATDQPNTALSAEIIDSDNQVVGELTRFTSSLLTGGFIPELGNSYQIKLSSGQIVSIPQADSEGFVLQVNNLDPQKAFVRVAATPNFVGSTVKLLGSMNGVTYLEKYININESGQVDFEISKTGIPRGVMQLRLLGENSSELAQRPIWIDGSELNIDVRTVEAVSKDELVVQITVTDQENKPVETELALGINQINAYETILGQEVSTFNISDLFMSNQATTIANISDKDRRESFLRDINLLANSSLYWARDDE